MKYPTQASKAKDIPRNDYDRITHQCAIRDAYIDQLQGEIADNEFLILRLNSSISALIIELKTALKDHHDDQVELDRLSDLSAEGLRDLAEDWYLN